MKVDYPMTDCAKEARNWDTIKYSIRKYFKYRFWDSLKAGLATTIIITIIIGVLSLIVAGLNAMGVPVSHAIRNVAIAIVGIPTFLVLIGEILKIVFNIGWSG